MATIDDLFPSPYLKSADVANQPVVTIAKIEREKMKNKEGKEELKPVLYFQEFEKGIVLNRTNANIIEDLYGKDIDEWIGAKIQLHAPIVEAFGESKPAIRVIAKKPAANHQELIDRYSRLYQRGVRANVEDIANYVIDPKMTDEEILALGKELKVKVQAAEQF